MNTFLLSEATERRTNRALIVAESCLLTVAGVLALMVPALATFGDVGLVVTGSLGMALLTVSGLAIRYSLRIDNVESTDDRL